ncbi:prefoldin subunit 6 [Pluteus cervinus]|uniref:Prefoldin subunit 6 n=1 Tax=Pluteus cervinus TaxID=181527 RepID=A0ACD3BGI0_9AGAR|nr:prefoldin subunit 6 [Pluteus cervinus]
MAVPQQLQQLSLDLQKIQGDLSSTIEARQRLDAQLSENELVQKEFKSLTPENVVYKQLGPVLVKQDQEEAKQNVATRLDFIRGEIKRVENQLKDIQAKADQKKQEIANAQANLQVEPSKATP